MDQVERRGDHLRVYPAEGSICELSTLLGLPVARDLIHPKKSGFLRPHRLSFQCLYLQAVVVQGQSFGCLILGIPGLLKYCPARMKPWGPRNYH